MFRRFAIIANGKKEEILLNLDKIIYIEKIGDKSNIIIDVGEQGSVIITSAIEYKFLAESLEQI